MVADERDLDLVAATGFDGPVLAVPDERLFEAEPAPAAELAARGPGADRVHVGHGRRAQADPPRARATCAARACRPSTGSARGRATCAGARPRAAGRCRPATSSWRAWLRGAAALLHDARFDPAERLELLERERVNVLCMAPTEYRAIAKRASCGRSPALRHAVAAGEPLNPEVVRAWQEAPGSGARRLRPDRDRPPDRDADRRRRSGPARWAGPARVRRLDRRGRAVRGPGHRADLLPRRRPRDRPWRTGDRVREDEDGYLWFEGRTDDVIISAGYRIGPFEVESALVSHPAVAEAAAVAAPDEVRGQVVRAVVVLRDGHEPGDALASELQEHVRPRPRPTSTRASWTSPTALPKTPSGKIKRAELRGSRAGRATPGSAAAAGRSPASARAPRARGCRRRGAA